MSLPDNRIRFPSTRIDFTTDVGVTGQDHDNYPAPNTQPRYDWMRIFLLGLLANQSSAAEPSEYRDGSLWMDLSEDQEAMRVRMDSEWKHLAEALILANDTSSTTLAEWYRQIADAVANVQSEICFSGACTQDNITTIPIPGSLRSKITLQSRCFIYKNGLLINPRLCSLVGAPASSIKLTGVTLDTGDEYIAAVRSIPDSNFYTANASVP